MNREEWRNLPDFEYINLVLTARRESNLRRCVDLIINRERTRLYPHPDASGRTPCVLLDGINWADFALQIYYNTGQPPKILELGAGDRCTVWTAPIDDPRLDDSVRKVRGEIGNLSVVCQSGYMPPDNPFDNSIVSQFYAGHFLDVLRLLLGQTLRFDVIISRHSLYMTAALFEVLLMIDQLLSNQGAAFLDTVSKGCGNDKVLIYAGDNYPRGYLTRESVWKSLSFNQIGIGRLKWQKTSAEGIGTAWRKGQIDKKYFPKLVDVNFLSRNWFNYNYFDFFRLIYSWSF